MNDKSGRHTGDDSSASIKGPYRRVALILLAACVGAFLVGLGFHRWAERAWLEPGLKCFVEFSPVRHEPDSSRFAYSARVRMKRHTRGALRALGPRLGVGSQLDVLVYDFSVGGRPRRVFSKSLRRSGWAAVAGWNQEGIHLLYDEEGGAHHIVIDPDAGTSTPVLLSESKAIVDSLTRAAHAMEDGRRHPKVVQRWMRFYVTDRDTGERELLFDYGLQYEGIPLVDAAHVAKLRREER